MRRAAVFAVWWAVLTGLWLLFIAKVTWAEVAAGAAAGASGGGVAVVTMWAARVDYRPRRAWLRWFLTVPKEIVTDTAWLAVLLMRRMRGEDVTGRFRRVTLPPAPEGPSRAARDALATLALSTAPGSYVVRIDPDTDAVLLHEITPGRSVQRRMGAA